MVGDGLPPGYDAWRTWHPDQDADPDEEEVEERDPDYERDIQRERKWEDA